MTSPSQPTAPALEPQVPAAAPEPPIVFSSSLPGDAHMESSDDEEGAPLVPTPAPQAQEPSAPVASTSSAAPPPPPTADPKIVTITSTPASGLKTRDFHAKYFSPVDSSARPSIRDLPESYFAPTASELQTAFAGQVRKREQLVDAPLLTRALREREENKKKSEKAGRWPQTRIRVRFSDRSQLEGVFPSGDTLFAIYEFVKCSLAEEHRLKPFVLYQTPPKREYKKTDPAMKGKSLIDLQLTPSSVFYIKFDEDALNEATPPPLIPALLSAISSFPLPPPFDPTATTEPVAEPKSKSQKLGFGGSAGKVTPAWMKLGKSGKK